MDVKWMLLVLEMGEGLDFLVRLSLEFLVIGINILFLIWGILLLLVEGFPWETDGYITIKDQIGFIFFSCYKFL